MTDIVTLKTQQKILNERIKLVSGQSTLILNLRATKARSKFIQEKDLDFNVYKFGPQAYLELVKPNEKCQYPEMYEIYKVVSQKE